jgi:hypothetical protein
MPDIPANFKAEFVGCFGQPVAENPTGAMQEAAFGAARAEMATPA